MGWRGAWTTRATGGSSNQETCQYRMLQLFNQATSKGFENVVWQAASSVY